MLSDVLNQLACERDNALIRLCDLLRFPSISTDPNYKNHIEAAANWLVNDLNEIGFTTKSYPTSGHPVVMGRYCPPDARKHVLFYGHYDVQPPDPVELWQSDPFEPQIIGDHDNGKIVARGACDDKGQLMTFVEACRAWMAVAGKLPVAVTIIIEGEEESNSVGLEEFLQANAKLLSAADIALICDTSMRDIDTPAIVTALRGMMYDQVTVTAANRDLHSGEYGGAAHNPINLLAKAIGDLHDDNGRITIPGFYDGVDGLDPALVAKWNSYDFDSKNFLAKIGLNIPAGEKNYSLPEKIMARPTLDVNGIIGGYTGHGSKTVIPSTAMAKISCRLVGEQEPAKIRDNFRQFIKDRMPADCKVEFEAFATTRPAALSAAGEELNIAAAILNEEWNKEAVITGCGGTIPVVGQIKDLLAIDSLLIGFGLDDDGIHSPNEKYQLRNFFKGARFWARLLPALAG